MQAKKNTFVFVVLVTIFALVAFPSSAHADHSWGGYHWARTANPLQLQLGDNVSGLWDELLVTTSEDWSKSSVLDTTVVPGGTRPASCQATRGRVEVCSANYHNTGWLGVAQIWTSGASAHIIQATVKNNDYYYSPGSSYSYNNKADMLHTICQEVGHTFGLGHQDETGANLDTCMDYSYNTSTHDKHSTTPNAHDYEELEIIYAHLDSSSTALSTTADFVNGDFSAASAWGKLVSSSARESTYVRDFGRGNVLITYVIWSKE